MAIRSSCCRLHFASAPPPQRFATHLLSTAGMVPLRTAHSFRSSQPLLSQCTPCLRGKSCIFRSLQPLKRSCLSFCNSRPLFSIDYSLFSRNAGGGILVRSSHPHFCLIPDRSSISFRINTCKSVSKQTILTSFRINTYEKPGEGEGQLGIKSGDPPGKFEPDANRWDPKVPPICTWTWLISRRHPCRHRLSRTGFWQLEHVFL
jgi:hypothetical protein